MSGISYIAMGNKRALILILAVLAGLLLLSTASWRLWQYGDETSHREYLSNAASFMQNAVVIQNGDTAPEQYPFSSEHPLPNTRMFGESNWPLNPYNTGPMRRINRQQDEIAGNFAYFRMKWVEEGRPHGKPYPLVVCFTRSRQPWGRPRLEWAGGECGNVQAYLAVNMDYEQSVDALRKHLDGYGELFNPEEDIHLSVTDNR